VPSIPIRLAFHLLQLFFSSSTCGHLGEAFVGGRRSVGVGSLAYSILFLVPRLPPSAARITAVRVLHASPTDSGDCSCAAGYRRLGKDRGRTWRLPATSTGSVSRQRLADHVCPILSAFPPVQVFHDEQKTGREGFHDAVVSSTG